MILRLNLIAIVGLFIVATSVVHAEPEGDKAFNLRAVSNVVLKSGEQEQHLSGETIATHTWKDTGAQRSLYLSELRLKASNGARNVDMIMNAEGMTVRQGDQSKAMPTTSLPDSAQEMLRSTSVFQYTCAELLIVRERRLNPRVQTRGIPTRKS